MLGNWDPSHFPHLDESNCELTSPTDNRYNCIAWAADDVVHFWWPDSLEIGYWPPNAPREETIDAFCKAYGTLGYTLCYDCGVEPGLEKIAIFGMDDPSGSVKPTHAARQLPSGKWTSKMGRLEDITHGTADAVRGPQYGRLICCMSRPTRNTRS